MMQTTHRNAKNGVDLGDTLTEYFFKPEVYKTWTKGILRKLDRKVRQEAGKMPLYITEWNSMAVYSSPVHDEKYSAAFLIKSVMDLNGSMNGYMFWCCSDVFEELFILGKPFHGSYGIVSNDGIPKPNFWGFKLLSELYPNRLELPVTDDDVEYAVFTDGDKTQILLYQAAMLPWQSTTARQQGQPLVGITASALASLPHRQNNQISVLAHNIPRLILFSLLGGCRFHYEDGAEIT